MPSFSSPSVPVASDAAAADASSMVRARGTRGASPSVGSVGSRSASSQIEETAAVGVAIESHSHEEDEEMDQKEKEVDEKKEEEKKWEQGQEQEQEQELELEQGQQQEQEQGQENSHLTDSSSDVEIVEVRPAVARRKRKSSQREIVSLLDDDSSGDDDHVQLTGGCGGGGGGGGGGEGPRKRRQNAVMAMVGAGAVAAAKEKDAEGGGKEEKEYKRRWLKALECTVCMEPLCTAAHISCGHIACFTCIHRRFAHQSFEDGSAYGFQERKRLCPTCRKDIFFMSRDVKMDELVEESMSNDADMMAPCERMVWEERKRDGLALARYYEAKLCNNPQQFIHRKKDVMIKAVIRAIQPFVGEGGGRGGDEVGGRGRSAVCHVCRQRVEGGKEGGYEATWSLPAAQGFKPIPSSATVHLECLRDSACKAIRKGLSPEGMVSLSVRLDVQSLFVEEEGGLEGFRKRKIYQVLSEERQDYPWWVDGKIKLQILTNRRIQLVPLPVAFAVARGSGSTIGIASGASAASSVVHNSSGTADAAVAAAPQRRTPRRPQQQPHQEQQQEQQQPPRRLVLDVDD